MIKCRRRRGYNVSKLSSGPRNVQLGKLISRWGLVIFLILCHDEGRGIFGSPHWSTRLYCCYRPCCLVIWGKKKDAVTVNRCHMSSPSAVLQLIQQMFSFLHRSKKHLKRVKTFTQIRWFCFCLFVFKCWHFCHPFPMQHVQSTHKNAQKPI